MAAPMLSHLDAQFLEIMDDMRGRLARVFQAPEGSLAIAISGTGTSAMEVAVANTVQPGTRVLSIVTGYFGDRLSDLCRRYGGEVRRLDVEWGRACDPAAVERALKESPADVVTLVHAETSTGVLNPVREVASIAHQYGALIIVDAVTSLGALPLDVTAWDLDVVYSCSQKGLGAPSGVAPIVFAPSALARKVQCRSFAFDLSLLESYWVGRKYHHTMCASLIYALREALAVVEEETLTLRWDRHERHHKMLVDGLEAIELDVLPPPGERLWTLNAVRVPAGVDEALVRRRLLQRFNIEVGAGLGPLAGKIWRVGLMGSSSTEALVTLFLAALRRSMES